MLGLAFELVVGARSLGPRLRLHDEGDTKRQLAEAAGLSPGEKLPIAAERKLRARLAALGEPAPALASALEPGLWLILVEATNASACSLLVR